MAAGKAGTTPKGGTPATRARIVTAAKEALKHQTQTSDPSDSALEEIMKKSDLLARIDWSASKGIPGLVKIAEKKRAYHSQGSLKAGDIVLFHNVFDANRNGENDDWYTGAGVVVECRAARFAAVASTGRELRMVYLKPDDPHRRRLDGQVVNSFLRAPSRTDKPRQAYMAGELYAGFIDPDELIEK